MKQSTTISHDEIRKWVETHHGRPSIIGDFNLNPESLGVRIDFPGKKDEELLPESVPVTDVTWNSFFQVFDDKNLAFIYSSHFDPADPLSSFKFINRDLINEVEKSEGPFNPDEFTEAIKGPEPEFFVHGGVADNPQQGEIEQVETESEIGEEDLGGDTPGLDSDDDTTQAASDVGLLEPEDKKRLKNQ